MSAEQYEQFFADADADGSGELDFSELINMLKGRGYSGDDSQIKAYFNECDVSGDGKISKKEYLQAMGLVPRENHMEASMRSCFRQFDTDGSGSIDAKELKQVFAEMGKAFTDAEMERMIGLADKDNTGTLEYEEFIKHCFGK